MIKPTEYAVFSPATGFDPNTAEFYDTIDDAAWAILNHDQQRAGVEKSAEGEYVPWQQPHRGPVQRLARLAAESEAACLAKIWAAARRGEFRGRECLTPEEVAEIEAGDE